MADNGFNLATLWVPVVPETSQVGPAMEKAGKDAKGKFGDGIKGFGKAIHDDLDKIGQKAKDAFSKAGKTAGDAFNSEIGKELRSTVNKEIEPYVKNAMDGLQKMATDKARDVGHGISKSIGDAIGGSLGGAVKDLGDALTDSGIEIAGDRVKDKFKDIKRSVDDVKNSFADLKSGNYDQVLKRIDDNAEKLPDPLKRVRDQVQPIRDGFQDIKNTGKDVIDTFAGLELIAPRLATGLAAVAAPLGEIAGSMAMVPKVDEWLKSHFPSLPLPDADSWNWLKQPFREGFGDIMHPSRLGHNHLYDKNGNYIGPGANVPAPPPAGGLPPALQNMLLPGGPATASPAKSTPNASSPWANSPWFGSGVPATPAPAVAPPSVPDIPSLPSGGGSTTGSSFSTPRLSAPSVGSRADLRAAGGRVANLLAFANSLVGTPYSQALRNDCSGMVAKLANVALGLEPAASFSTVNEGQWLFSHGFEPGLGGPNDLNIGWYDHGGGNLGHTAATLPGGIHAESGGSHGSFLLGAGAAGAENPEFTQHAHLSMDRMGSSGALGGQIPTGAQHDPLYVTQASGSGGSGGDGSPFESQGQQLGQGMVNGILQMFGLDGSVFKGFGSGKGLLDFGALKLGGGLLNWGSHLMQARGGAMGPGSPTGGPGMAMGGDGASIPGLGMLQGLGANISARTVPAEQPGAPRGGNTTIIHGDVNSGFNVTQHGVQGNGVSDWKEQYNSQPNRAAPLIVPNAGGLPAG